MRIPDEIRKSVLFIGVYEDLPEPEWRATAYLVTVPGAVRTLAAGLNSQGYTGSVSYPFRFLATARHVARKLEGKEFAIRVNNLDGSVRIIKGHPDTKWWYHPTEEEYVDAAVTVFPDDFGELDLLTIHLEWFADEQRITEANIGAGDEVFIAGLFTKITETTKNIPLVRIGNLASIPGERIPFKDGKLIDAYLVETRSIGGLSGSPVFVRQTINMQGFTASGRFLDSRGRPLPMNEIVQISGLGRTYFLGSMIGHWDAPTGFAFANAEAVNMGISPMVPAHKIREILMQPGLIEMVKQVAHQR
jgi:hypothetical protein